MDGEAAVDDSVEVEKIDLGRLVWLLSPPCNSLDGHDIVFISAHFRLTGRGSVVVSAGVIHTNVSLRINWLHDCFSTNGVKEPPVSGHKRRELSCDFDSEVVPIVLQAMPHCSTLTHARFSFCGYEPLAVERLLFLLCERLRSTPTLSSLHIDISFPLRKPKRYNARSVKDVPEGATIREFSPILVRNQTLKTLLLHSDSHTFDCVAAEHIALFVRENTLLESLDLRLLVTLPEFLLDDLWLLIRPLSNGDRFGCPSHDVVNKTLRTLVLQFFFWKTDWPLHLAKHVQESDSLVKSSFLMCPFLHKLSLSLVSRNVDDATEDNLSLSFLSQNVDDETLNLSLSLITKNVGDGSEAVHVAAETRCREGHRELHILKCDERASVSSEVDEIGVLNLDTLMWKTLRCANADVLVLQNSSPAAVPHYIQYFRDAYRGLVSTIKLSSTAKDEDIALQRARVGAVVESILNIEGPLNLHVEMTHRDMSLISAGKNSEDMRGLLSNLRDLACLQSFIVDKWELRRVDGVLLPLFAGAVVCTKSVEVAEVYEVKVKMSSR